MLGSNLKPGPGTEGGAGIRNSLGWVGVSLAGIPLFLFGIKGAAVGPEQSDALDLWRI